MPEILKNLSPQAIFIIILVVIFLSAVVITIIALRGKLGIKIGNKSINLGGSEEQKKNTQKNNDPIPLPVTVNMTQKRSCGDCVLLLMGEREKYEFKIRRERDKIMKVQMTFAEQKLIEIQTKISNNVSIMIHESIKDKITTVEESVQYILVYCLLKDSLLLIKDEIRRSFKDNGFFNLSGSEFSWYVKERTQAISSMLTQYMRNIYPDRGGVLQLQKILRSMEEEATFLSGIINDIYSYASEVRIETDERVKKMQEEFGAWVDKFTK